MAHLLTTSAEDQGAFTLGASYDINDRGKKSTRLVYATRRCSSKSSRVTDALLSKNPFRPRFGQSNATTSK
jgi:hypothetical protein